MTLSSWSRLVGGLTFLAAAPAMAQGAALEEVVVAALRGEIDALKADAEAGRYVYNPGIGNPVDSGRQPQRGLCSYRSRT